MKTKSSLYTRSDASSEFILEYETMSQERRIMLLCNTKDLGRIVELSLAEIAGWQVFTAELSPESLALVETIQPDIILLDTVLPNLDQLAILQAIQTNPATQNLPIVLLTERMRSHDIKLYQRLGAVGAIAKPFDIVNLAEKIAHYLNK